MKLFLAVMSVFALSCTNRDVSDPFSAIRKLPPIKIGMLDSTSIYSLQNGKAGRSTLLVYFDPTCDHCRDEIADILTHSRDFNDINIYLLSFVHYSELRRFADEYRLNQFKSVVVGKDIDLSYSALFNGTQVPLSIIYNDNRELQKIIMGQTTASEILNVINQRGRRKPF